MNTGLPEAGTSVTAPATAKTPAATPKTGRRYSPISPAITEREWAAVARSLELSPRELEIIRGIFDNQVEDTIASDLAISTYTVHTHLRHIFKNLHVTTRLQLVLRVMKELHVLITAPDSTLSPICRYWETGVCPFVKR